MKTEEWVKQCTEKKKAAKEEKKKLKEKTLASKKHKGVWGVDENCAMTRGETCELRFCKHRYQDSWSCCGSTDFSSKICKPK